MTKKLYRSREDVMVAGICAGVAEYFKQDPTIWRIGFVLLLILTGLMPGLLIYILAWVIVPVRPEIEFTDVTYDVKDLN